MEDFKTSNEPLASYLVANATETLQKVKAEFSPDRCAILVEDEAGWKMADAHGFPTENFWTVALISRTVISTAIEDGKPLLLVDVMKGGDFSTQTSVVLTGMRSVMGVPIPDLNGRIKALVYADNQLHQGAFTEEQLDKLVELANELGERLFPSS